MGLVSASPSQTPLGLAGRPGSQNKCLELPTLPPAEEDADPRRWEPRPLLTCRELGRYWPRKLSSWGPLPRRAHPGRSDRSILRLLLDALASDLPFIFSTSCLVSACGPVRKRGEEAVLRFAPVRDQEHLSPRPARLRGMNWSLCSKWGSRGEGHWGGGSCSEGVIPGDRRCLTHRERTQSSPGR